MPLSRRQVYRRRRLTVFGALALVLAALIYTVTAATAPVSAVAATLAKPATLAAPAVQPDWPDYGAGAIGAVGFPGVLETHGDQSPVPIASITKMVTALLILQAKPLSGDEQGPDITFTDADVDIYYDELAENGSVAPVVPGMVLTERQALTGMLLPSANNYAVTLVNWAYGSVDAYLPIAKDWLKAHGLDGTTVADTSGLSPSSRSTPADLVDLAKLVMANPVLASIVALPTATLPTVGALTNTNHLLGTHGVTGIKTGTTDEAGACLLFAAQVPVGDTTVTLVGVLLGGDTHPELDDDIGALIDSVQPGFQQLGLATKGESFGRYTTEWGESATLVAATDASVLVWSDTPVTSAVTARPVTEGDAGDEVGSVEFTGGAKAVSVPLVLADDVAGPSLGWRLTHPGR
ncbi:D-alanyl-D-alanine carboxypeptidase family protein [Cryobacterium tepidiphilum]|uniref:D-alanyl-D-alanine carboxypeptidase n=1 Tax=Cryobacterium tepidiphilum TaxID=2486026 RepID=A0A3M8LLS9_9MICO|nr:D-alanyl-D-alanine carboxypeptidase [Cryobacterium tepidiphilum]RNE66473.1 D-alanyl-D-alanine carboxypeptidase [Cryobacterium tepidiphilum]